MTFEEYFDNYLTYKNYNLSFSSGNSVTIADFYNDCIVKTKLDVKLVEAWHSMFIEYSNLDDAIFWIRKYEGGGTRGSWDNRRACLTKYRYNGQERYYASISNFDVQDIYNMISLGIEPPDANEFLKLMKNFQYRFHYDEGSSCVENKYAAYPRVPSHIKEMGSLSANKWYLAHIHGIFNDNHISKEINEKLFPPVKNISWELDNSVGKYVRDLNVDLTDNEYDVMKACFLRFVDPINYYIVPNSSCEVNDMFSGKQNKSIGEYDVLSYYVYENSDIYFNTGIIDEFEKYAIVKYKKGVAGNDVINVAYRKPAPKTKKATSPKTKKTTSSKTKKVVSHTTISSKHYTESDILNLAKEFLENEYTYKYLDKEILKCTTDRHGNTSFNILKKLGLDTTKRGILSSGRTIDDEISISDGLYKETLVKIKNYFNI